MSANVQAAPKAANSATVSEINEAFFIGLATDYSKSDVKRVIDALARSENWDDCLRMVEDLRGRLTITRENGAKYTPAKGIIDPHGGMNASAIASQILGLAPTTGEIRKRFSDFGKSHSPKSK